MKYTALIILIITTIISIGAYIIYSQKQPVDNPPSTIQVPEGPIIERGVITCVPKIGTGPQTMECALGLKNTEGLYYGLRYLSDYDENFSLVSPDITVEITGIFIDEEMFGPDGNRYDILGMIEIKNISEI